MCSDGWSLVDMDGEIDGVCPDCGEDTVIGEAPEGCYYSPVACKACGDAPCDGSC